MILKRAFDILVASAGLLLFSPLLGAVMLAIWLQDRRSPFYIAPGAPHSGGTFRIFRQDPAESSPSTRNTSNVLHSLDRFTYPT
jgi:lipopolysaccharide/colanic/teichoic acid biosynthesis glycosyltransferase